MNVTMCKYSTLKVSVEIALLLHAGLKELKIFYENSLASGNTISFTQGFEDIGYADSHPMLIKV